MCMNSVKIHVIIYGVALYGRLFSLFVFSQLRSHLALHNAPGLANLSMKPARRATIETDSEKNIEHSIHNSTSLISSVGNDMILMHLI